MSTKERYFSEDDKNYIKKILHTYSNIKSVDDYKKLKPILDKKKTEELQKKIGTIITYYKFNDVQKVFGQAIDDVTNTNDTIKEKNDKKQQIGGEDPNLLENLLKVVELIVSIFGVRNGIIIFKVTFNSITYSMIMLFLIFIHFWLQAIVDIVYCEALPPDDFFASVLRKNVILMYVIKFFGQSNRILREPNYPVAEAFAINEPIISADSSWFVTQSPPPVTPIIIDDEYIENLRQNYLIALRKYRRLNGIPNQFLNLFRLRSEVRDRNERIPRREEELRTALRIALQPPEQAVPAATALVVPISAPIMLTTETRSIITIFGNVCLELIYGIGEQISNSVGEFSNVIESAGDDIYDIVNGGRIMRKNRRKSRKNRRSRRPKKYNRKTKRRYR
jgi:hypothetical protein